MRMFVVVFLTVILSGLAFGQEPDQIDASFLVNTKPRTFHSSNGAGGGVLGTHASGKVLGVDSLVNWSSYFYLPGVSFGFGVQFTWPYTMVGTRALRHGKRWRLAGRNHLDQRSNCSCQPGFAKL